MASRVVVPHRPMGSQGLVCSSQGLGCMGMTAFYVQDPRQHEEEALRTIEAALAHGVNMLDTAWIYQNQTPDGLTHFNETLVGRATRQLGREKFVIATKFMPSRMANGATLDGIRQQLTESLSRLDCGHVDLYYMHRVCPKVPIEHIAQSLKQLQSEGLIKHVGLSEVTPSELRRFHAITPVTAIQIEWNVGTRDVEEAVVPCARELGVGIVAYSPLCRGLLAGAIDPAALPVTDRRSLNPRFTAENFSANKAGCAEPLAQMAATKGCTAAQLSLAWVHAQGGDVFPIPGTKSVSRLLENVSATAIKLSPEEEQQLRGSVQVLKGNRYPPDAQGSTFNTRL